MKATLEFDLTDDDDRADYDLHLDARALASAVDGVSVTLRNWLKYDALTRENFREEAERLRADLFERLSGTRGTYG